MYLITFVYVNAVHYFCHKAEQGGLDILKPTPRVEFMQKVESLQEMSSNKLVLVVLALGVQLVEVFSLSSRRNKIYNCNLSLLMLRRLGQGNNFLRSLIASCGYRLLKEQSPAGGVAAIRNL